MARRYVGCENFLYIMLYMIYVMLYGAAACREGGGVLGVRIFYIPCYVICIHIRTAYKPAL